MVRRIGIAKSARSVNYRYLLPLAGSANYRYLLPLTIPSARPPCCIERSTRDHNTGVEMIHLADNLILSARNNAHTPMVHEVSCHSPIQSSWSCSLAGSPLLMLRSSSRTPRDRRS